MSFKRPPTFRFPRITVHCTLITFYFLLSSCSPQTSQPPRQSSLLIYRFDPPAFIEFSEDFQPINEIPFHIPPNCGLFDTFPAPVGNFMAIELNCPGGQTILFLDASTSLNAGSASVTQPVTDADSHFLAWTSDGRAAYLKVDSLGNAKIIRQYTDGSRDILPINEFTYDLAAKPDSRDFTFTFSRGLGYGSEIHLARHDGRILQLLYADQSNYISFARFSPDGEQLAFIKIPDTQTPFTVGELWVMDTAGSNPRKLADADAGHGYAANWSPDGKFLAFVVRENPREERANQSSQALISNVYIVEVENGRQAQITNLTEGRVETPFWLPAGNTLVFNAVINGRMNVSIADVTSGEIRSLITDSACCPAWIRK
jgi:dipeptidyl aminopeptidase/acylaminoacyl peptidase